VNREKEDPTVGKTYEVLIVDDETQILKLLKRTLESAKKMDYNITIATNGEYGLKQIKKSVFDIVLSDYKMPRMDGIEFLKKVREESPETLRFMITGQGDLEVAKEAINKADIDQYIEKPWDTDELLLTIQKMLKEKDEGERARKISEGMPEPSKLERVEKAIKDVEAFQKKITEKPTENFEKEKMMFEFESNDEFNEFSFQVKNRRNINIIDVQIFENKYVITVGVFPESYEKVK